MTQSDVETVVQARKFIFELLSRSGLLYEDTLQTLDHDWDLLGPDLVATFLGLLLIKSTDQRMNTRDGLHSALWGLKNGITKVNHLKVKEMTEISTMVSADLKLCNREAISFRESQDAAEKQWNSQSSLISSYMSKLESVVKELTLRATAPVAPHKEPSTEPEIKIIKHTDGFHVTIQKGEIINIDHPQKHSDRHLTKMCTQANNLISSKALPFKQLTRTQPSFMVRVFSDNMKRHQKDINKASLSTYEQLIKAEGASTSGSGQSTR